MTRKSWSLVYCLFFLILAEVGLRIGENLSPPVRAVEIAAREPILFFLGSSRTRRAMVPRALEATLAREGVPGAWAADVTRLGYTSVGLAWLYDREIHPLARSGGIPRGYLGIEVRASALNDAYMEPQERAYLRSLDLDSPETAPPAGGPQSAPPAQGGEAGAPPGFLGYLARGEADEAARTLFLGLHIALARDKIVRPLARRFRSAGARAPAASPPPEASSIDAAMRATGASWARGDKGWEAFDTPARDDLDVLKMRVRYAGKYLRDFHLGGAQTRALRWIIEQARADGLHPFLYDLPVTPEHREFFFELSYDFILAHARRLAREERVPFFDADGDLAFLRSAFHDTHHLRSDRAEGFSREFAGRYLTGMLRGR